MILHNFAGFVCEYQFSDLYFKYFSALGIAFCVAALAYLLGIKRIKHKTTRRLVAVALVAVLIVGAHFLYVTMLDGDFMGCGVFPWAAHPNPN